MTARIKLTPQMAEYEQKFTDGGEVRWLPYLMYFHPTDHRSEVVNTDTSGFRYSELLGIQYSVANSRHAKSVRVLAGSSTVFGIGASSDAWTLPSRLAENDPDSKPWINFGGRSFNSTQELTLFTLYRHLLPKVDEIVLFSGFNNLGWPASHKAAVANTALSSTATNSSTPCVRSPRRPSAACSAPCSARNRKSRRPSRHRPWKSRSTTPPT